MTPVIGIGAGGHGKVVIDILARTGQFAVIGLVDSQPALWGTKVLGVEVVGGDDHLPELRAKADHAFIGVGSIGDTTHRRRLVSLASRLDYRFVRAIHAGAMVGQDVRVEEGSVIMAGAVLNAGARVESHAIVNTGAIIEHDCVVGAYVHIAPGAILGGGVTIGDDSHIGIGAVVLSGVKIGPRAIVGGGAVIVKDVPPEVVMVGVPASARRSTREHPRFRNNA